MENVISCYTLQQEQIIFYFWGISLFLFHVDIYGEYDILLLWHRHLKGEDLNSLQPKELIMIEEALDNGLTNLNEKLVINLLN